MLACLMGFSMVGFVFGAARPEVVGDGAGANAYADIPERNVFGLKPQPRHEDVRPPTPPVAIKISGFYKHANGPTHVLLASMPKNPKDTMKFYNLCPGESDGEVSLLRIHPAEDAVDVVVDGIPEVLTVKSNSFVAGVDHRSVGPTSVPGGRRWR
jgi:hypothetical protein